MDIFPLFIFFFNFDYEINGNGKLKLNGPWGGINHEKILSSSGGRVVKKNYQIEKSFT